MSRAYIYVVDRDFGFAPNPFHGCCTLATCKPGIRKGAQVGDWIVGMGGARLKATGRCIFSMRVSETVTFEDYWADPRFFDKRPVRHGSRRMMVGDNIYHRSQDGQWLQADSHHSLDDGSPNLHNLKRDTGTNRVLVSRHFRYFGSEAPAVPDQFLDELGYANGIGYRVFDLELALPLIRWLDSLSDLEGVVLADPNDFGSSEKRYSVSTNAIR